MDKTTSKKHVGRPTTGRKLARYWLKLSTIGIINDKARKGGFRRDADYLEATFTAKP